MSIALDIWPDDSRLLAYMADLEMAFKHNYEAGKSYMKRAFECNNAELDLLYEIKGSLWYDCLNDKKESLACLEKAVSLNRSNFNLVALASRIIDTDPKRADQLFEEVLLSDPKEADVIDELARIALKKEDWQKGFELATRAHKLEPSDAGINASLAYANQKLGRFDEALSLYLKAEEFGFYDKVFIYNSMAECYQGLGNSKEARVYAKKVLDINLDDAKANRLLDQLSQ